MSSSPQMQRLEDQPEVRRTTTTVVQNGGQQQDGDSTRKTSPGKGITVWQASLFIIGEVAGSGLLSLPSAIIGTGYMGFLLMYLFCLMSCYAGVRLGTCWTILEERYDDCCKHNQSPLMFIGEKSYGPWMRKTVNVFMNVNLFGDCVVYLLVMAAMTQQLFQPIWNVSICYWLVILTCALTPLTWFGTPKDFWGLAAIGTATVVVTTVLLFVQTLLDIGRFHHIHYPDPSFKSFSLAFGTILFGYGGSPVFPTIQNDMRHRKSFPKSAILAFSGILMIYTPVSLAGYFVYGHYNLINSNLANTVSSGALRIMSQVLLVLHIMFAFVIVMNPLFQDFERRLNIAQEFNWKRCLFRTIVLGLVLFVGETVPHFGKVLNLIGGSTSMSLSLIFPVLFYYKLARQKDPRWKERDIPLHEVAFMFEIILLGVVGGIASTVSAVWDIVSPDAFVLPCFIRAAVPDVDELAVSKRSCCS